MFKIGSEYGPRFAEFAFEPAFTGAVDQHLAELRERLSATGPDLVPPPPDHADLADCAPGFLDALAELDRREPVGHDYAVCRPAAISRPVHRHRLLPEQRPGD